MTKLDRVLCVIPYFYTANEVCTWNDKNNNLNSREIKDPPKALRAGVIFTIKAMIYLVSQEKLQIQY